MARYDKTRRNWNVREDKLRSLLFQGVVLAARSGLPQLEAWANQADKFLQDTAPVSNPDALRHDSSVDARVNDA